MEVVVPANKNHDVGLPYLYRFPNHQLYASIGI